MFDFLKKAVNKVVEKVSKKKEEEKDIEKAKESREEVEKKEKNQELESSKKEKEGKKTEKKEKKKEQKKVKPKEVKRKKIEEKAKVGLVKKVASLITGKVKIEEKDIEEMLDEFEIHLIEADTALEVAEEIKEELKNRIVGKEIEKGKLKEKIREEMEKILLEMLPEKESLIEKIEKGERPYVIVFFGPNGAGKTTTIAKIANLLKKRGLSVVVSASDTFRAAAIEQLQIHCDRVGVKLIKSTYGADPSSVAYNAINHAKSKGIDVVLIDTAGRLEVDTNLMKELEKIVRVAKPDLKLFVAESITGNSLYEMVREYNEIVGIDGVILTKIDLDPKGGVLLSLYKATGVPVYMISKGQGYDEIEEFDKEKFVERILSE